MQNPLHWIDGKLNSITMYRLVLYALSALTIASILAASARQLSTGPLLLILSASIVIAASQVSNQLFVKLFRANPNTESAYITGFILFFIIAPLESNQLVTSGATLVIAAILANISKYLIAYRHKHILNPAAAAALMLGLFGSGAASWWVATPYLMPLTLALGLLVVRKIRREAMFTAFLVTNLLCVALSALAQGYPVPASLSEALWSFPVIFFGTIMLTEPLSSPTASNTRTMFGALVGALSGIHFNIGPIYSSPELALIAGNVFAFLVSSKQHVRLTLKTKSQIASGIYHYTFTPSEQLTYLPGQYMEWTLPHTSADTRGNRRYFTIASSPTEETIQLGVRIDPQAASSFKRALLNLEPGQTLTATQVAGEFTLPPSYSEQRIVMIAGGIGITPFRSMIKFLLDTQKSNTQYPITLLYCGRDEQSFAYSDVFTQAQSIGLTTNYIAGQARITREQFKAIPEYTQALYYLSGPNAMVEGYKTQLQSLGIPPHNIKTDYFPGF